MKKKNIKTIVAALAIVATMLVGANVASAHSGHESLVDKLATKFNLNKTEVQAVFDEDRKEREAEMTESLSERLQKKVDSGDITAEQKNAIEKKLAEQKTAMEAIRDQDLSEDEKHEKMNALRDSLREWTEENDLTLRDVMPMGRGGMGGGFGRR